MKVFVEEQRFDQWWFRVLMLLVSTFVFGTIAAAYPSLKTDPAAFWTVLTAAGFSFTIITILIFFVKLQTKIDELGIHYAFWPLNMKPKLISWSEITSCKIKKYYPLKDYGGWGYRTGFLRRKGGAINVKGNIGIQIVFKTGKRLLIGTQNSTNARKALDTYNYKLENS